MLNQTDKRDMFAMLGSDTDLETCVAFRDLMFRLGCDNIDVLD